MSDPWQIRLKNAHDANDPQNYYRILAEEFAYGVAALGVVQNNTFAGIVANNYAQNKIQNDLNFSYSTSKQQEI